MGAKKSDMTLREMICHDMDVRFKIVGEDFDILRDEHSGLSVNMDEIEKMLQVAGTVSKNRYETVMKNIDHMYVLFIMISATVTLLGVMLFFS